MPINVKVSMGWHRGNSRNLRNAGDGNRKEKNDLSKKIIDIHRRLAGK